MGEAWWKLVATATGALTVEAHPESQRFNNTGQAQRRRPDVYCRRPGAAVVTTITSPRTARPFAEREAPPTLRDDLSNRTSRTSAVAIASSTVRSVGGAPSTDVRGVAPRELNQCGRSRSSASSSFPFSLNRTSSCAVTSVDGGRDDDCWVSWVAARTEQPLTRAASAITVAERRPWCMGSPLRVRKRASCVAGGRTYGAERNNARMDRVLRVVWRIRSWLPVRRVQAGAAAAP